ADYNATTNPDGTANIDHIAGLDPARNGEPYGELGLISHQDPFWQLQHGKPNQQPPGNIPGGKRLVTGRFTASSGSSNPIAPAAGTWTLTSTGLNAAPTTAGAGTFALISPTDTLPDYFEMTASLTPGKVVKGSLSNAYLIFNYIS